MKEYTKKEKIFVRHLYSSKNSIINGPRFIAKHPNENVDEFVSLIEPPIAIVKIGNVMAMGGTDLLFKKGYAIHPDIQDLKRDVIPAEYHGVAQINAVSGKISLGLQRNPRQFQCAINLLGNCTGNYAHWLTETLPKLIFVDEHPDFIDYPILIDESIHPNFISSIRLFNKSKREIIEISKWESVFVESLIDVSPPGYAPPENRQYYEKRIFPNPASNYFNFSTHALNKLRIAAWDASICTSNATIKFGEKLYLCRPKNYTGNGRLIVNIDEVEKIISKLGFTLINPAEMSLTEQIALFKNAKFIVSAIGAALANAIFLPPNSNILILSPYHENANYYYFSNLMGTLGHKMHYLIGPQVESKDSKDHIVHKNYYIDLDELEFALETLVK